VEGYLIWRGISKKWISYLGYIGKIIHKAGELKERRPEPIALRPGGNSTNVMARSLLTMLISILSRI
jgi:hypothetical protein